MREVNVDAKDLCNLSAEVLARSASIRFVAKGSSMRPFVCEGDILTIEPVESSRLRIGDIVLYRAPGGGAVVHRLLRRKRDGSGVTYLIRGDGSRGDYEHVGSDQILGRVTEICREAKTLAPLSLKNRFPALLWAFSPCQLRRVMRLLVKWIARLLGLSSTSAG